MPLRRRDLLARGAVLAGVVAAPGLARAGLLAPERRLHLVSLHTSERLDVAYFKDGDYDSEALTEVRRVLRDYRTGEEHPISVKLLDALWGLSARLDIPGRYEVISGYRSPHTNATLHAQSGEVAAHSLHMEGMAMDIRAPGVALPVLHQAALSLSAGGVGYYPQSGFVHVDVGRVRRWSGT